MKKLLHWTHNWLESVMCSTEVSTGHDLDWSGSGLLQFLLNLDWIRTANHFKI